MIQEKLQCPYAEGLCVIACSPVSSPLSSAVLEDLLGCQLNEGSPTRFSTEQKDTQSTSPTTTWYTLPQGGSSQHALGSCQHTQLKSQESLITQVMLASVPLIPI